MKVDNLALQHIVRFTGNKSDFTKQPVFKLFATPQTGCF